MSLLLEEKKMANKEKVYDSKKKKAIITVELTQQRKNKRVCVKAILETSVYSLFSLLFFASNKSKKYKYQHYANTCEYWF